MNISNLIGYISLHRQIFNWHWWNNIQTRNVFIVCLLLANYKDSDTLKRGQLMTSLKEISMLSCFSIQEVRTAIKNLKKTNEITIKSTNNGSIITISKYDIYQSNFDIANNQLTNNQHDNNNVLTNNQQLPNNNISNKEIIINENEKKCVYSEDFIKDILTNLNIVLKPKYLKNFVDFNNNLGWKYEPELAVYKYITANKYAVDNKAIKKIKENCAKEIDPKVLKFWDIFLAKIKTNINNNDYKVWILPIKPIKLESNTLTISVPSTFFREYIETNFISEIGNILRGLGVDILLYSIQ